MSTHDKVIANDTFPNLRSDVNAALAAIASQEAGTADPPAMLAYERQARSDLGIVRRRNAANGGWILDGTLAEAFGISRASNTILSAGNHQTWIIATSTFTQTITAAATLGDGWYCYYRNNGTGVITLDPNSSETIDGATTKTLAAGQSCIIFCTSAGFITVGLGEAVALEVVSNTLGSDVNLSNTGSYFDGPTVAQGTTGTWFVSGTITVLDTAGSAGIFARLWDGTSSIASGSVQTSGASVPLTISLSGSISAPAGNLRISARDSTLTTGKIKFNVSGLSQDSTITAIRIA